MAKRRKPDTVEQYARDVISGTIVAGRLVRHACERHLRDLAEGPARGLVWDRAAAESAFEFYGHLRLAEGEFEDQPFLLQSWQKFIVGSLHGWKRTDGARRFRTAYCEIGKGNGKSPMAAAEGLHGLVADDESAAEIYSAATTREQAGILFRDAKNMTNASPALAKRLKVDIANIGYLARHSFFRPCSSEARGLDGKRVHVALIDELHEHPTALVVDKMRAGTKGRRQALIFEITNSGYDRTSVCWAHHEYSVKVLEGLEDDTWFAYVCSLDPCEACRAEGHTQPRDDCPECDDWRDRKVWLKANPNLGVSIPERYLEEQVREATGMPSKASIVKRLNFCIWTEAAVHAIPMDRWDACERPLQLADFHGRDCFAGLDIGATRDFTAFVMLFPHDDAESIEVPLDPQNPEGEKRQVVRRSYSLIPRFWLPERPASRDSRAAERIERWRHAGFVQTTPGDVVDYDAVLREIVELSEVLPIHKIAFDYGFQGSWMGTNLLKHFGPESVMIFRQGIFSMSAPFRELLELLVQGRLHHDGNPVMRWMASNTAAEQRGGLIKPSKDQSAEKIDGITAATMGLGVAMTEPVLGVPEVLWL